MVGHESEMLKALGVDSVDGLFRDLPPEVRVDRLDLPEGRDEIALMEEVTALLERNRGPGEMASFLGGGWYDMYVPPAVDAVVSRSEFYTSYTPYQAELSQGLMQALFEYQSLVCELTGLDAANSSMYDGASALGEAALMAARITRRREFVVPDLIHWEKRQVLENYARGGGLRIRTAEHDRGTGRLDPDALARAVGGDTAGIYVELPTFLGLLDEGVLGVKEAHPDPLLVVGVNPLSLGVVKPPGAYGADIVVGEGQPLGNWLNFGGPSLGLFACRQEHVRRMPGRVIGLTRDAEGRRAFAMTLQTREQHIRKERAMSNICTNESLLAVATAVYLSLLGEAGFRRLGATLMDKARDLMARIDGVEGYAAPVHPGSYFNEFPVRLPRPLKELEEGLLRRGIHPGLDVSRFFPEDGPTALFAVTDRHTPGDFDRLETALEAVV